MSDRRIVIGFSGGVTSAWCVGWALRNFPREEVVLLFHDTKEEDDDTYRFIAEMSAALGVSITERSDGRSVTELCYAHNMLPNNLAPFCSRILKVEQGEKFIAELKRQGIDDITMIYGFSGNEPNRVQRKTAMGWVNGYKCRFPLIEEKVTKQDCADWCQCAMGVAIPAMYEWSDHANCPGCARGGKAYWLQVRRNRPKVFEQRKGLEAEFGHTFNRRYSLVQIEQEGLFRKVNRRESIEIGSCECGE